MHLLNTIHGPADLRSLDDSQLTELADEIRDFLVQSVCRNGGHLGSNLGMVELTVALHRVFDSPRVPILFDVGHQAYVHKILTGRREAFAGLRAAGGMSGYPNRAESDHDHIENSHASTALSYADGLSRARALTKRDREPVVAVIGDGALTGGLAWEALNNLGGSQRRVIVVVNDNGRSYSPTVGSLAQHLSRLRGRDGFRELQSRLGGGAAVGPPTAASVFAELGFAYRGPVDGHDVPALESALRWAAATAGPTVVHCVTAKGRGFAPAVADAADHLHSVGVVDPTTGRSPAKPQKTWTDAFAEALVQVGEQRDDVVAVSAAMLGPTGLQRFAVRFPDRCFDVGIAEQHAMTGAAGLAMGGLHPVVAVYATFANRGFDQLLLDIGLHRLPVTLVLDRAGVTGPDGASHHGMWDLPLLGSVPGMKVAAPRDASTLTELLDEAVAVPGPTALRFPKAKVGAPIPSVRRLGDVDILARHAGEDLLIVATGALAGPALEAAGQLAGHGVGCTVVDPRWLLPVPGELVDLAGRHQAVMTVEDGVRSGGFGSRLGLALADSGHQPPVRCLGLPTAYLPHGARDAILAEHGLDASGIAAAGRALLDRRRTHLSLVAGP